MKNDLPPNPDDLEQLAEFVDLPGMSETLHQAADGRFYLERSGYELDGRRLKPHEDLEEICPEVFKASDEYDPNFLRRNIWHEWTLIAPREALRWCARTQLPPPLRGYFMDML